jgi:UDP-N-acetylmuramoylalanine--D-glutamate ligase
MTRWLARQGAHVTALDTRGAPPHLATARELPNVTVRTGEFRRSDFDDAEVIALSPGLDPRVGELGAAIKRGLPVAGDVELFAQTLTSMDKAPRVIAITGSNGKSTVTAMCGDMCKAAGRDTVVAGNIGLPVLDVLDDIDGGRAMPDTVVLELSSFQLETTASLNPRAATLLNISEDHLDRYDSLAGYVAAKMRIFAGDGVQVLNRDDAWSVQARQAGRQFASFGFSAPLSDDEWGLEGEGADRQLAHGAVRCLPLRELPLAGLHNAANALAAGALCHAAGVAHDAIAAALRAFKGLPHRVQYVEQVHGVVFYDDSKGTNVGATVAALKGATQPVVLIAGGDGKGQDFSPLAAAVAARARAVVLIGRDAEAIARVLTKTGVALHRAASMASAVEQAYAAARPGDAVLLSPACASYDMFRSYVHRAQVFADCVRDLARREGGQS